MTQPQFFPIIIVGGGPAGLATALHLKQRAPALANDLIIIEAKEYPRPKLCGGGITIHGEEQLAKLGIKLDVPYFRVDSLRFRLGEQEFVVPHEQAMRVIQRSEFDAALADTARQHDVVIHSNERVREVYPIAEGYEIITDKATYHTRVLIATDGANSLIRRKLKFHSEEGVARLLRVLTPIDPSHPTMASRSAIFDFSCIQRGIQGYMWDFPCMVDGVPHMNSGIFDSRITPKDDSQPHGNLKATFADFLAQRGVDLDQTPLKGHPVRWFAKSSEFSRPHVLLAGDAAGVDALFAEGISYAMEYGSIVADMLIDAFETNDYNFSDYRDRILAHRMGKLLMRRVWLARTIFPYHVPPFWWLFWRFAAIAPHWMQQDIGAWMALLPEKSTLADEPVAIPN
ncbi:MAG: NAD(P)/FAD-dependent oxidoreductase [Chloroflexota bacterium]